VHPDCSLSARSMSTMNSFIRDIFERIAEESRKLIKYNKRGTLSSREIQAYSHTSTHIHTHPRTSTHIHPPTHVHSLSISRESLSLSNVSLFVTRTDKNTPPQSHNHIHTQCWLLNAPILPPSLPPSHTSTHAHTPSNGM